MVRSRSPFAFDQKPRTDQKGGSTNYVLKAFMKRSEIIKEYYSLVNKKLKLS